MIQRKKKIVLYQPQQVDESLGLPSSKDLLPLELLTISAFPVADGYEIEIIDGSLYSPEEAHRRVIEACEGAMMYATTGILGYMVTDGWLCSQQVKARHPELPMFIGGWFATSSKLSTLVSRSITSRGSRSGGTARSSRPSTGTSRAGPRSLRSPGTSSTSSLTVHTSCAGTPQVTSCACPRRAPTAPIVSPTSGSRTSRAMDALNRAPSAAHLR